MRAAARGPVTELIEQLFEGPLPLVDVPSVTYGSYGTWSGDQVVDQTNADVCRAIAAARQVTGGSRRAFAMAANVRSPRDLDAILSAAAAGRGARWSVTR